MEENYHRHKCRMCDKPPIARTTYDITHDSIESQFCSTECFDKYKSNLKTTVNVSEIIKSAEEKLISEIQDKFNLSGFNLKIIFNFDSKISDIDKYIDVMSDITGISSESIKGKSRKREIVQARQIVMYTILLHKLMHISLANLGNKFCGRDHSTVIHAKQTISDLIESNDKSIISLYKEYCSNLLIEPIL